ncbi:MAG: peptidoglycan-associated lipoprotein Pal [Gammaproteobacteria bacterium]|nr:peptidoglycan-associated lipoprotein Pal [Gammaproteobacteria bacterium]
MKRQFELVVLLVAAIGLGGCASSTKTDTPGQDGTDGSTGSGADTGSAPAQNEAVGESIPQAGGSERPAEWRVHFPFDSSTLDEEARKIIEAHGRYLVANPNVKVQLEGHCDERGTREYNLALGERRAQSVEKLLRVLGVTGNRVNVVSFGEEKPLNADHDEQAWAFNRRVEFIYQ